MNSTVPPIECHINIAIGNEKNDRLRLIKMQKHYRWKVNNVHAYVTIQAEMLCLKTFNFRMFYIEK